MRQDAEQFLLTLVRLSARAERRAETALHTRNHRLNLLAAVIEAPRKTAAHLAPKRRRGPFARARRAPRVEANRRLPDSQRAAAESVRGLGVKARIGHDSADAAEERNRLPDHGAERGRVRGGPVPRERARDEVRRGVDREGEFGMRRIAGVFRRPAAAREGVVGARGPRLEGRRIDGRRPAALPDQLGRTRAREDRPLRGPEGPPFSAPARRRCAA